MSCKLCKGVAPATPSEAHRHTRHSLPSLCTPEGAAAFDDSDRREQMFQTVELARQLLVRAVASNDARSVMPAARFFLHSQVHLDTFFDPYGGQRSQDERITELEKTVDYFSKESYLWHRFLQLNPTVDHAWLEFESEGCGTLQKQ
jgi:hypothetical protein